MDAGQLRERVTFQTATTVTDAGGGQTPTWADSFTVSAEVKPVRGRETGDAGRLAALQTYLITIRHRTDVTTGMRAVWGEKKLNIRSVENRDMRKRYLTVEAEEGVQNG